MNFKKRNNVVLKTAVASALLVLGGAANAGNIGTANRNFATELFNGSTPTLAQPVLAPISYQFGGPVAAASTFYVYVGLSNGATFSAAPATTTLAGTAGDGTNIDSTGSVGGTIQAVALAADSTYVRFTVVLAAGKSISTNSVFTFTPTVGIVNANGALATIGGTITATWVNNSTATTSTIPAGDIDATGTRSGTVATSVQGITVSAAASSAFPFTSVGVAETQRIDLAASPISTKFTTPGATVSNTNSLTKINLGALKAVDSTSAKQANGTTAYTLATMVASLSYTVTAPAGFFAALSTTGQTYLSTATDCSAVWGGSTSTVFATTAAAAAATSLAVTGAATPTTGSNYYVCMSVPGTTIAMVAGTPSLTATVVHSNTATDSSNVLASTPLYALTTNGASVDARNYVPAAVTGWTNFLRIINTGSIAAPVSAAVVNESTGAVGTSAVIITSAAPGSATTLNSTQIEAAIGAQAASSRPRIRITAPTNKLEVQNFLFTPNGSFSVNQGTE